MNQPPTLDPQSLSVDYTTATAALVRLRSFADLVMEQPILDFGTSIDLGIAYQIAAVQNQLQIQAGLALDFVVPKYIKCVSDAQNFCALWNATLNTVAPLLSNPTLQGVAKVGPAYQALAQQAGLVNSAMDDLKQQLPVYAEQLSKSSLPLSTAISNAVASLDTSSKALVSQIDQLNLSIQQNIRSIVTGADKVGIATSELISGILTTISDAKADTPKPDGEKKPMPIDFAVESIEGAATGATETAQARADLNANNVALAQALQQLAKDNALVAIAKVVLAQNAMLLSALNDAVDPISNIVSTWGVPPGVPPFQSLGNGISLNFWSFGSLAANLTSAQQAQATLLAIQYQSPKWNSLNSDLQTFMADLVDI